MTASSEQLSDPSCPTMVEATSAPTASEPKPRLSWLAMTIILSNIGLAVLALVGWFEFGSVSPALGYLRGDRLIPDAYSKDFGVVAPGQTHTVEFQLTNYSGHGVTVVGFDSSCTCASAIELPIEIPSSATVPLKVDVRAKANRPSAGDAFPISGKLRLYTNNPLLRTPLLTVTGRVSQGAGR